MDIIITYGNKEYIIELKIWHGENYEKEAFQQLGNYLESRNNNTGFLITFNFNKNKEYKREWIKLRNKDIYSIIVWKRYCCKI